MIVSRRKFLTATAATPLLATTGAVAAPSAPTSAQNAGWTRFSLGEFEITILSDGHLLVPTTTLGANAPREEVVEFLTDRFLDPEINYGHTNHVVIDAGDARVLVDAGSGDKFQPTVGRLTENLEAAGIELSSITHVALTHAHPDHVWGIMDDFGDEPRFPEAAYAINAAEFDWWTAEGRESQVPEAIQAFVVGARNALTPVAERTTMLQTDAEIVPGVRMISTPGHTIGHMSVLVESAGEALLVLGDAMAHVYASFERPDWHFAFDMDPAQTVGTRRRLLDMAATDRIAVTAYHFAFPGVGHVAPRGDAYQFIPALWKWSE